MVEWSEDQHCWHIETMAKMQELNLGNFLTSKLNDFVPIAVLGSHTEAHELIDKLEERMINEYGENWRYERCYASERKVVVK